MPRRGTATLGRRRVTPGGDSAGRPIVSVPREARPLVAIVGRPNVGKSTLFNRLVGSRLAIVADHPGTTRDRLAAEVTWGDTAFLVVDTGGLELQPRSTLWEKVRAQVDAAIAEADVIVFLTDVLEGVTPGDQDVAHVLRRSGKPVVLAAAKADNPRREMMAGELYQLGLGEPFPISAYHNTGIEDMLAQVLALLPPRPSQPASDEDVLHLAIVGRPNVGKSLLLNAILGQERAIVAETPGTTRDALDTPLLYQDHPMVLIDTAGVRRRGHIQPGIEKYSVLRALRAIDRADVVVLVLDATELVAAQDAHIAGQVFDSAKGLVIAVNKWDLAKDLGLDAARTLKVVRGRLKFVRHSPVCFVSALRREGISAIMDTALAVYREGKTWVPSHEIGAAVTRALAAHPPPSRGRRGLRVGKVAQEGVSPPTFAIYVNDPDLLHFSYHRYLENTLRAALGLHQTHIRLIFKRQERKKGRG